MRPLASQLNAYFKAFQSTHPRGVRLRISRVIRRTIDFNPRTHVGCDPRPTSSPSRTGYFNPRTHVGCDGSLAMEIVPARFQSTHPRGVRPDGLEGLPRFLHFNPRTHVGCDEEHDRRASGDAISIHAPTWGATEFGSDMASGRQFQSTHPRGVRPNGAEVTFDQHGISIHAPTWGATHRVPHADFLAEFQSTHPRGVRPGLASEAFKSMLTFQSTHPRGVRLLSHQMVGF